MPRYVKGDHVIETALATEGTQLRAQGFREEKARTKRVREAEQEQKTEQVLTPVTVQDTN